MPSTLRIFISSPGDVADERLRAALVIDKLAQDFRRYFTFEVIRWEHEPLLASGHFQDALDPPSEADIVVLILWSRLGTPLPPKTSVREYHGIDGRVPVTGTEWEYEDALRAARDRGAPDLIAFRNASPAPIDPLDAQARARSNAQLDALDTFWRRHFADRGVFLAAYDQYRTVEDFATRLEQSLRALIERRIKALPADADSRSATWFGPPFRGLQAYSFEHAPIFFGRDGTVAKAAELLASNARGGTAFLLVSGASGSGKSSLVQAALVPRLMKPQRIEGIAFLRRLVFRPGGGSDPLLGFVEALTHDAQDHGIGLPELLGPGQSAADLAALLREAADKPGFVFASALARLTEAERAAGRLLSFEEGKLIVVIDQLEELFTDATIGAEERRIFVRFLAGLVRSGAVWVVATLRADFWHRAAELPALLALAEGNGRIDVAAPSPAELAEMIRKPAQAAGISFETHTTSGLGLDAVLAEHAAAAPGVLPLLSFTLDALYAEDIGKQGGSTLTFASYDALGGLEGAIAKRADDIVAELPPEAQAAVPRVLRALTTIAGGSEQAVVARTTPLDHFPPGSPSRMVVDAFTTARLLIAAGDGSAPTVTLAHEALIGRWDRARQQLAAERRDLETRTLVERQQTRWSKATAAEQRHLLLRDPDLANAVDLGKRWSDELSPATLAFIAASQRHARRRLQLVAAAAVLFAIVGLTASVLGIVAYRAQQRAEATLQAATETANGLVFDLAQRFRNVSGVPAALIKDILDRARALQDQLAQAGPTTPALRHSQIAALIEIAITLRDQGATEAAYAAADRARQMTQELLTTDPTNTDWQRDLIVSLETMADVLVAQGNLPAALKLFQAGMGVIDQLAKPSPDDLAWQRDRSVLDNKIGDVQAAQGDLAAALASYRAGLAIAEQLAKTAPDNVQWQGDLATSYSKVGGVLAVQGHWAEALASYRAGLAIAERLAKAEPGNGALQRDLAVFYSSIGDILRSQGNLADALTNYRASFAITDKLAKGDPGNAQWQRDLSVTYDKVGDVLAAQRHIDEALTAYRAALGIIDRLSKTDPNNRGWQRDVAVSSDKVGDMLALQGNWTEALKFYEAAFDISSALAKADPGNARWLRDVSVSDNKIGDALAAQGKLPEALTSYQAGLTIRRQLAQRDPANGEAQRDIGVSYNKVGDVLRAQGKLAEALGVYQEWVAVAGPLARSEPDNMLWQSDLEIANERVGDMQVALGHFSEAVEAYRTSLAIEQHMAGARPDDRSLQRDVVIIDNKIGDALKGQGNLAEAVTSYRAALVIVERLATAEPADPVSQGDLRYTNDRIGDALLALGNKPDALTAYRASLAAADRLLAANPDDASRQITVVLSLFRVSQAAAPPEAREALTRALGIVERLAGEGKLPPAQQSWPQLLRDALAKLDQG